MELCFRRAVPEDAPQLKRLNEAFNGPGEKTAAAMAEDLRSPGGELVFVAQAETGLAGFCCCQLKHSFCYEDSSAELTELYVDPAFRRMGAASGLAAYAEETCRGLGACELTLLAGAENSAAQAFYEQAGFSLTGEVHYGKEL